MLAAADLTVARSGGHCDSDLQDPGTISGVAMRGMNAHLNDAFVVIINADTHAGAASVVLDSG